MNSFDPSGLSYGCDVYGAVICCPVVRDGVTAAYLWGSADDGENAASIVLILSALEVEPRIRLAMVWYERLETAYAAGLTPRQALESWTGKPEHSVGGGIPMSSEVQVFESLAELDEFANPGHVEPAIPEPEPMVDGFPVDRDKGWGPMGLRKIFEGYSAVSNGPVLYLPVHMGDLTIGYLWASDDEGAVAYIPAQPVQDKAIYARGFWVEELHLLHRQGLSPLEALRFRVGLPEHPKGGRIDSDEKEGVASSTEEIERIAD